MNLRSCFMSLLLLPVCLFAADNQVHIDANGNTPTPQTGPLKAATVVVTHLHEVIHQWAAGTGTQFTHVTEQDWDVYLHDAESATGVKVKLKSAFSVRSTPFLEVVEAHPAIGPWAPQTDVGSGPGFQVYATDNIDGVGKTLENAGMQKVAHGYLRHDSSKNGIDHDSQFVFYKAANGILIKLVTKDLLPPEGLPNVPQAPIDLGPIVHVDTSVQDITTTSTQLSQGLGVNWQQFDSNQVPFTFPDGVHLVDTTVLASTVSPIIEAPVVIELEYVRPPLGVWAGTDHSYNLHVAYRIPAGTMASVDAQMKAAGFTLNTYIGNEVLGVILSFYTTPENIWIEVVDERFDL